MDLKCNDAFIAQVNRIELITGYDIHPRTEIPETILKHNALDEASDIDRNYFAVTAFILALAGLILTLTMREKREMFLAMIGLAGAMCMFLMRIQIQNKIARDTEDAATYIINIDFVLGYWLTLILFLIAAFMNMYALMEEERKALRGRPSEFE